MADFKMPDLGGLMQAAQNMQREMQRIQDDLANKRVEAAANGQMQLVSIKIDPNVVDPKDVGMLQDLVTAAVNQALTKAKELANAEMAKVAGGMQLPGMPGLF